MRRRTLTELANNPDLISGIYNYCDRWCERCPLTSRCLVYATEQEENDLFESHDLRNEAFWKKLGAIFLETRELINEWAGNHGLDLSKPLIKAGKKYANDASDWFREFDQTIGIDNSGTLEEAREVVQWYQYQIAVKTMRALSSRAKELEDESDGSAKVALIGIERSMAAWRMMQLSLPKRAESIVPLILQLELLRRRVEKSFPQARDFMRPGFDEKY